MTGGGKRYQFVAHMLFRHGALMPIHRLEEYREYVAGITPIDKSLVNQVVDVGVCFALEGHALAIRHKGQINLQVQQPFEKPYGTPKQAIDDIAQLGAI